MKFDLMDSFNDFFNDWFDFPFSSHYNNMRTDVKENENEYQLIIEIPGFNKDDIKISYKNGYLTVEAEAVHNDSQEYVRKERYRGRWVRDYYVGSIDESKISANYENGLLTITIPKEHVQDNKKYISIN